MTGRQVRGRRLVAVLIASLLGVCAPAGAASGPGPRAESSRETGVARVAPPRLDARAAILVDATSGRRLYGMQADRTSAIASTTKLMTALVTLEQVRRLGRLFAEPAYYPAAADSQIGLRPGERMSVHDLLLALLLPSADDAAEDLAYNVGHGSVARFESMMNVRARQLGLRRTHYSTPIGLDTPGNYSTPADLAKLAGYLLTRQPFFARAVALPRAVLRTGDYPRAIVNRNDLVARFRWIDGVKTGHTLQAGYVLVASAHRYGLSLISVVLGTPSESARDAGTLALLGYGFAAFHRVTLVRAGQLIAQPPVSDQPGHRARVVAASGFGGVLARALRVRRRIELPAKLAGPKPRGARVGVLILWAGGRRLASIPLVLGRAIPAVSGLTLAARFIERPITLMVMLVIVLGVGLLVGRRDRGGASRKARPETA